MKKILLSFLQSTRGRLALSYWAIIMVLSIGFSITFYYASVTDSNPSAKDSKLAADQSDFKSKFSDKTIDNRSVDEVLAEEVDLKLAMFRADLLYRLILFNLGALVGGAALSYHLARRTLRPVEAAMEAQNRFVSDASHELRTPLTVMQAENEEALDIAHLPQAGRHLIMSNLEEIARLKALSDGLLQLAYEDKPIELQPVWVDDVAVEVLTRMVRVAQAKQITIEDAWPHMQVMTCESTLIQIIIILIDNALKYSLPNSRIYLESTQHSKETVQLHVRDTGVGINTANLPHIFDRFYRADSSRTKQHTEGHGLGLSIAQKLASQLHTRITVSSTPGEGSTFSITLQLAATQGTLTTL